MRRGKRSKLAKMRRGLSRHVSRCAHRDTEQPREAVNLVTQGQAYVFLEDRFGYAPLGLVHLFERGEVLSDSRGRGSLQRVNVT